MLDSALFYFTLLLLLSSPSLLFWVQLYRSSYLVVLVLQYIVGFEI